MIKRKMVIGNNGDEQARRRQEAEPGGSVVRRELAVGVECHPKENLYQVWCSSDGSDVNWVAAYNQADKAWLTAHAIERAAFNGKLPNRERAGQFFQELHQAGDANPAPVPDDIIDCIAEKIRSRASGVIFFELTWVK
ncbi:MAG: hypothetical protein H0T73_20620 [Ardenticatenales bacterium]|nr:hypothetical protein [Ardenticatenales bacterium]